MAAELWQHDDGCGQSLQRIKCRVKKARVLHVNVGCNWF